MDAPGPVFLEEPLQREVQGLASQLAGKGEGDLGFAGGEDEGGVDDAEGLREEG